MKNNKKYLALAIFLVLVIVPLFIYKSININRVIKSENVGIEGEYTKQDFVYSSSLGETFCQYSDTKYPVVVDDDGACCKCFVLKSEMGDPSFINECEGDGIKNVGIIWGIPGMDKVVGHLTGWLNLPQQEDCDTRETFILDKLEDISSHQCPVGKRAKYNISGHSGPKNSEILFSFCTQILSCNGNSGQPINIEIGHDGCSTFADLETTMKQVEDFIQNMERLKKEHPGSFSSVKILIRANQSISAGDRYVGPDPSHETVTSFVITDPSCPVEVQLPLCADQLEKKRYYSITTPLQCLDDEKNIKKLLLCPVFKDNDSYQVPLKKGHDSYEIFPFASDNSEYKYVDSDSDTCSSYCSEYEAVVDGKTEKYIFYYDIHEGYEYAGIYRKIQNDGYTAMCKNNRVIFEE